MLWFGLRYVLELQLIFATQICKPFDHLFEVFCAGGIVNLLKDLKSQADAQSQNESAKQFATLPIFCSNGLRNQLPC